MHDVCVRRPLTFYSHVHQPSSPPHRRRSRFLRDRNYAINYSAPYLSFLSLPFFCLPLELLSSLFNPTAIANLRNNQKVCSGTYFIGTRRNRLRQGRITSCFLGNKPKSLGDVVSRGISGIKHKSIGLKVGYIREYGTYMLPLAYYRCIIIEYQIYVICMRTMWIRLLSMRHRLCKNAFIEDIDQWRITYKRAVHISHIMSMYENPSLLSNLWQY